MAAALSSGCSLIGVRLPNDARAVAPGHPPPVCTRNMWLPALDLGATVVAAGVLGFGLVEDHSVLTALGAGATPLLASSTAYGFLTVEQCKR